MKTLPMAFRQSLVLALVLLLAPSAWADGKPGDAKRPWTILLYGAVDNSADDAFVAFTDQVRRAIDDDPGIELIMLIDRSNKHSKRTTFLGDDFQSTRLYRVKKDSIERLSGGTQLPEITKDRDVKLNSADAATLQRFIAFGKAHSPAQRYGLLIYSHANGKTMCPVERIGDEMGIAEVTDKIGVEERVDFLALELCNMGGLEIAYQWRQGNGRFEADVLLAIPNAGPPLDWDRAFNRIRSPGHAPKGGEAVDPAKMTAADFGKLVIEEGHRGRKASERPGGRGSKESAGCYDLRKTGEVKKAVDALAVALSKSDTKSVVMELRNAGAENRLMNYSEDGSYVDLYDLCRRVAGSDRLPEPVRAAAKNVMKNVEGFMIASFGMSGYKQFEAGKNGVFIVMPSGRPNCWKHFRWYTPTKGDRKNYGNWSFLKDGATPGNGIVENWFELLESWFNVTEDQNGNVVTPEMKQELEKFQGEWIIVSMEQRGRKAGDQIVKRQKLTIKGDQWTVTTTNEGQENMRQWTFKIDPSKTPKTIDMTIKVGNDEHVSQGIYKLEGDTLTLCRTASSGDVERPKEFKTTAEEGILVVWKRVQK